MRVIGTAGHVDHGKSTLVQALTGIHPDRLKEEREREMTIDLGFAWLSLPASDRLPEGEEVGIIDVPGHRDFIENMLSGVGGIDAALFVIAADEGIMPQTREHLAILDILQVGGGVIALTKVDLVDDPEWLELVEEDVRRALRGTVLETAPLVRVSARTGVGIKDLISALSACLSERPARPDLQKPRLSVDRIFTMSGFGTVVTGTLIDGSLGIGDEIEVLGGPVESRRGRVRGLQTHKRKEDRAVPGARTAINISGVDVDQIRRGDVITRPGLYTVTNRLDARFRLLADASQPLKHSTQVKFFTGAAEVLARLRLLGAEELRPGQEGWLQIELNEPLLAVRGDHYILRRPSPGETLGGGVIVDPHPQERHKRFSQAALDRLEALAHGTPSEVLFQALTALGVATVTEVIARSNLESEPASTALQELWSSGQLFVIEANPANTLPSKNTLVAPLGQWEQMSAQAVKEVTAYHQQYPLRRGMPREELKSRLRLSPRLFSAAMHQWTSGAILEESGPLVALPGHAVRFSPQQQRSVDGLLARFEASPYSPPAIKECMNEVGEDVYNALIDQNQLLPVSPEVVFRTKDFDHMVEDLRRLFTGHEKLTAAEVRDHFNTSRRYVLAFLEYLDTQGITIREGDSRHLRRA